MFLLPEFHLFLGHAEEGIGQGGALRLTGAEQADFPDIALFQREQLDLTPGQTVPQGQAIWFSWGWKARWSALAKAS